MPRRRFAALAVLLLAVSALFAPVRSSAQTGPVLAHQPNNWYVGPPGINGYSLAGGIMTMNWNRDSVSEHHPLPPGVTATDEIHLTPSRKFLYTRVGPRGTCGASVVRFYSIPTADNAPMIALADSICLPANIAYTAFFDTAVATYDQHVACIVMVNNTGQTQALVVDLNTGLYSFSTPVPGSLLELHFAPAGVAAWLKFNSQPNTKASFGWMSLCPDSLGFVDMPVELQNLALSGAGFTSISATVLANGSRFDGVTFYPNPATERQRESLSGCMTLPVTGSCCLLDGSCRSGTTQYSCGLLSGSWQGAGTTCATTHCPPPPAPDLHVVLTGQTGAQALGTIAYALSYSNTGNAAAASVTIRDAIPTFTSFVRASNGGGLGGPDAVWSLGTVAAGAAGVCSLYVTAPCNHPTISSGACSITASNSPLVPGTGSVSTTVTGFPTTTLTVTHAFEPLSAMPLSTGDKVRYTLTLTNTLNQARTGLTMGINAGNYATIDTVLNAGGGTATPSGNLLSWTGTIAPLATATIVFQTRVTECRPPGPGFSVLTNSAGVSVFNPCGNLVGFWLTRDTVQLAPPPVAVSVSAPTIGGVQDFGTSHTLGVRTGGPATFRFDITNTAAATSPAVNAHLALGSGLIPAGNPPFSGTPPAGATWNNATKTIDFSGTVAAHDTVRIAFAASVDTTGSLTGSLIGSGDVGACFGALAYTLTIVGMHSETGDPHLLGLSRYEGLWTLRPGIDTNKQRIVGFGSDTQTGLARTRTGELWVTGSPTWRANPATGLFEVMNAAFATAIDMDFPGDVAFDPGDSTLVFAGYKSSRGLRVARWNPRTRVAATLYSETNAAHGLAYHVKIDAARRVVVTSGADLLWIDPAVPGVAHVFHDTGYKDLPALAVDSDGNYTIVEGRIPSGPGRLASVDRTTGVFTVLHGGDTLQTFGSTITNLVVSADNSLYGSFDYGSVFRLARPSWAFTQYAQFGYNDDLEWVGPPPANVGVPPAIATDAHGLGFAPPAPNPTSGGVTLAFSLPAEGALRLAVYDLGGRRVREIANERVPAGVHTRTWDGRDASGRRAGPGLYFVRLETAAGTRTQRLVIAR